MNPNISSSNENTQNHKSSTNHTIPYHTSSQLGKKIHKRRRLNHTTKKKRGNEHTIPSRHAVWQENTSKEENKTHNKEIYIMTVYFEES